MLLPTLILELKRRKVIDDLKYKQEQEYNDEHGVEMFNDTRDYTEKTLKTRISYIRVLSKIKQSVFTTSGNLLSLIPSRPVFR
jgi:hypothetical protein